MGSELCSSGIPVSAVVSALRQLFARRWALLEAARRSPPCNPQVPYENRYCGPSLKTLLNCGCHSCGGMAEWLIAAVLKTALPLRVTGVQIPLPPPHIFPRTSRGSDIDCIHRKPVTDSRGLDCHARYSPRDPSLSDTVFVFAQEHLRNRVRIAATDSGSRVSRQLWISLR